MIYCVLFGSRVTRVSTQRTSMTSDLNIVNVREQFPALRNDYIFADSAGGSQVSIRISLPSVEQAHAPGRRS
jgi:hypothetical protein